MTDAAIRRAERKPPAALRPTLAVVLAVLVLLGLASSGLAPPERADIRPLVPREAQQANASARAPASLAARSSARRTVAAATPLAVAATTAPRAVGAWARPHQDADLRRVGRRLGIEIRGPPVGRFA